VADAPAELPANWPDDTQRPRLVISLSPTYIPEADVLLSCSDAIDCLQTVPDESVNLIVSSPPYNIGKVYERRTGLGEYLKWQASVLRECRRVLKHDGSLCWQVGNYVEAGEVFPLDAHFYRILKKLGLKLRNRIIWYFEHGLWHPAMN
jgi:adenine-specific DNA-methyltransferase